MSVWLMFNLVYGNFSCNSRTNFISQNSTTRIKQLSCTWHGHPEDSCLCLSVSSQFKVLDGWEADGSGRTRNSSCVWERSGPHCWRNLKHDSLPLWNSLLLVSVLRWLKRLKTLQLRKNSGGEITVTHSKTHLEKCWKIINLNVFQLFSVFNM